MNPRAVGRKHFDSLTAAQQRVFEQIAIGNDLGHNPAITKRLEVTGYIVGHDAPLMDGGWPPVTVRRYEVPLRIHARWCAWCDEEGP